MKYTKYFLSSSLISSKYLGNLVKGLLFFLFLISGISFASAAVRDGLVTYFPFNGSTNDAVGINDLTNFGAKLVKDINGTSNSAYFFNVSTTDWMNSTNTLSGLPTGDDDWTFWIRAKPSNFNLDQYFFLWGGPENSDSVVINHKSSQWRLIGGASAWSFGTPANGVWQNIICTHNSTHTNCWENNSMTAIGDQVFNVLPNYITLGNHPTGGSAKWLNGTVDEVAVWDRTITDAEIAIIVLSGMPEENAVPNIPSITSPYDNEINSTRKIEFNTTDLEGNAISFTIYINGTLNITTSTNITVWNGSDGFYNLTITANDSLGVSAKSEVVHFFHDTTQPSFSNQEQNETPNINQFLRMNITVLDVFCNNTKFFWNHSGSFVNDSASTCISSNATSTTKQVTAAHQNVCWGYWANDTAGNSNTSSLTCFTVANTIPNISSVTLNNTSPSVTDDINITCIATDEDSDSLTSNFKWFINSTLTPYTTSHLQSGNITLNANITGFCNVTDGLNFIFENTSTITIGDSTIPKLNDFGLSPTSGISGVVTTITVNCTDDNLLALDYPFVAVQHNLAGLKVNKSMSLVSGNKYSTTHTPIESSGTYDYTFYCQDGSGNTLRNDTNGLIFTITSTSPSVPGGGGGGPSITEITIIESNATVFPLIDFGIPSIIYNIQWTPIEKKKDIAIKNIGTKEINNSRVIVSGDIQEEITACISDFDVEECKTEGISINIGETKILRSDGKFEKGYVRFEEGLIEIIEPDGSRHSIIVTAERIPGHKIITFVSDFLGVAESTGLIIIGIAFLAVIELASLIFQKQFLILKLFGAGG